MKSLVRYLVPDGLTGRLVALLVFALLAANLIAFVLLSFERDRLGREAREERVIARIAGLVPALESVTAKQRRDIARSASTRIARVRVERDPLVNDTHTDAQSRTLAARLSEQLAPRTIRVGLVDGGRWPGSAVWHGVHETIAVSILLNATTDGARSGWLNVRTRGGHARRQQFRGDVFVLVLGLSLVAVLGVGLLFVRYLTRPLTRLADAARSAGRGNHTVRIPENGAREMREAASAFNTMQSQISAFDAERMRTLAAVGHDLRTPITSLRIRAEMLDDDLREPMVRTLDEMTVMADELVAYARGDEGAEETRSIALGDFLKRLCEERGAEFGALTSVNVPGRPVALSRAIGNLVDNALRYGGRALVDVSLDTKDVIVTIDDDGPGIPSDRVNDMFEPFVRGENSRNATTGGVGLGLSIAHRIVRAHGGSIDLINRDEGGLRAVLRLPLPGLG